MDLSQLFVSLKSGSLFAYEAALGRFDIAAMPDDDADRLLVDILDMCRQDGLIDKAVATLARWQATFWDSVEFDPYTPEKGDIPAAAIIRLFAMPEAPRFILDFVVGIFRARISVMGLALEVCTAPPSPQTKHTLHAIFDLFGTPIRPNLETLQQEAFAAQNMEASDFLIDAIRREAPFASRPSWVGNYTEDAEVPHIDEIVYPPILTLANIKHVWEPQRIAGFMVGGQLNLGIPGVDLAELLRYYEDLWARSPEDYFAEVAPRVLAHKREGLQDDETLFRILGPAHAKVNFDLAQDHPCAAYGGCRMFLCQCSETYDEGEEDDEDLYAPDEQGKFRLLDWFRGSCDYCLRRIANPYHAVRKPLLFGGWQGTFCGFDCMRNAEYEGLERQGDPKCQPGRCTAMTDTDPQIALIDLVEKEIRQIGIQDRIIED